MSSVWRSQLYSEPQKVRSGLTHDKICKIARTIADLDGIEAIQPEHVAKAISYRKLDRKMRQGGASQLLAIPPPRNLVLKGRLYATPRMGG